MQRVTSLLPSWDRTKTGSKKGLDTAWKWADKLGAPVNRLTNRIGSEAFWPTTLDKESDKAARILRSFCKDGFYTEQDATLGNLDGPHVSMKQRVLKKIPQEVIQNAVGLAIFTTMRSGLWISGAGGSGILVARTEDGSWSPPSGILLHTAGLGFLVGIDIYDCVVVINNRKALGSFTKLRATLGGEVSAVAGPVGIGGVLENDGKWKQLNRPVFTYLKSRGFYAGVQVDGTIIIERTDENEKFYGERIGVADILAGKVRHPPHEIKMLMETLKAAEGSTNVDQSLMEELEDQPAPGDVNIEAPSSLAVPSFGIPEPDDPDPFGVLALEKAGLEIKEAGTKSRPPSSMFEYRPNPTSPVFSQFHRRSVDSTTSISNRGSYMSAKRQPSSDRVQMVEMSTQTDPDDLPTPPSTSPSLSNGRRSPIAMIKEEVTQGSDDNPYSRDAPSPHGQQEQAEARAIKESDHKSVLHTQEHEVDRTKHDEYDEHDAQSDVDLNEHSDAEDEEEPVVFEAAAAQPTAVRMPQIHVSQARGNIVTIQKRIPPTLPPRSPMRNSNVGRRSMMDRGSNHSPLESPTKDGFDEIELNGSEQKHNSVASLASRFGGTTITGSPLKENDATAVWEEEARPIELKDNEHLIASTGADHRVASGMLTPGMLGSRSEDEDADMEGEGEAESFHSIPTTPLEVIR